MLVLFCCEGGACRGYEQAGWDCVGVDFKPQRNYQGAFIQADALTLDQRFLRWFDAIHASPPCQFCTDLNNDKSRHLNLIPQTRSLLKASGLPYVIENVRRAREHLLRPVSLFGTMFDCHAIDSRGRKFVLSRERLFETNWPLSAPADPGTQGLPIGNVYGGHFRVRSGEFRTGKGTGRTVDLPGEDRKALAREIMGMPWATMGGMSEAVPPAYTAYIGRQLLEHMKAQP